MSVELSNSKRNTINAAIPTKSRGIKVGDILQDLQTGAVEIRNETGGTLPVGTLVYLSSYSASMDRWLVAKADADVAGGKAQLVLREAVLNLRNGKGYKIATLKAVNTNGSAEGNPTYLSAATAGTWALAAPSGGDDIKQVVGRVEVVSATAGVVRIDLTDLNSPVTVGTNEIQTDAVTNAKLAASAVAGSAAAAVGDNVVEAASIGEADLEAPTVDALHALRWARASWSFAEFGGAIAAQGLGVTIPDNAIVLGGLVDVVNTCTSNGGDAGTGALSIEGANDLVVAIAISDGTNPWDAGLHAIIPVFSAATAVKTTAAREVTFTIAGQTWTAGSFVVHLAYVVGG